MHVCSASFDQIAGQVFFFEISIGLQQHALFLLLFRAVAASAIFAVVCLCSSHSRRMATTPRSLPTSFSQASVLEAISPSVARAEASGPFAADDSEDAAVPPQGVLLLRLLLLASLSALARFLQLLAAAHTAGVLQTVFWQLGVPFTMVFSTVFLNVSFLVHQHLGCVLLLGILLIFDHHP